MTGPDMVSETEALRQESRRLREQLAATAARLEVLLPLLEEEIDRYRTRTEGGRD